MDEHEFPADSEIQKAAQRRSQKKSGNRSSRKRREDRLSSRLNKSGRRENSERNDPARYLIIAGRTVVMIMVLLAPWWLGSVTKIAQLVLLSLAMLALLFWWLELAITKQKKHVVPYVAIPVAIGILFGIFQLVPLSDGVASIVAPKQLEVVNELGSVLESEKATIGNSPIIEGTPTRVSLNPEGTWEFVQLSLLALIGLFLGAHYFCSRRSVTWLLGVLTLQGFALALFGIIQQVNFNGKIFWILERTQGGKPFASFVNRNNATGYLLICLAASLGLAYLAISKPPKRKSPRPIIGNDYAFVRRIYLQIMLFLRELTPFKICALTTTTVIATAIVISLSRGGIIALLVSAILSVWIVGLAKAPRASAIFVLVTACFAVMLVSWLGFGQRISDRFESFNNREQLLNEGRLAIWKNSLPIIADYPVVGSGMNSFRHVYRGYRSSTENRFNEFAENQYVQTLTDTGVIGFVLLLTCLLLMTLNTSFLLRNGNSPKTTAATVFATFALVSQMTASVFDFGLFIPANMLLFAVVCGFISGQTHALADRLKKKNFFSFQAPKWLSLAIVFVIFVIGFMGLRSWYNQIHWQKIAGASPLGLEPDELSMENCRSRIDQLETLSGQQRSYKIHKRLAGLYLHEFRLRGLERQQNLTPQDGLTDDQKTLQNKMMWDRSRLVSIHQRLYRAKRLNDEATVRSYLNDPLIREYIPKIHKQLLVGRYYNPMDPGIHLLLAQVEPFINKSPDETHHLQRATQITPYNLGVRLTAGILYLQSGRLEQGKNELRNLVTIQPTLYKTVIDVSLANGLSGQDIVDEILPIDKSFQTAAIYYQFATGERSRYLTQSTKSELLERADDVLTSIPARNEDALLLHAEIKIKKGDIFEAISIYEELINLSPMNEKPHKMVLDLYEQTEQWDKAAEECRWLSRVSQKPAGYTRRLQRIRKMQEMQD